MAIVVSDRVKETTSTSGVADLVLAGVYSSSHESFEDGIGNGNATYYAIENGSNWEVGSGIYTSSSNTLSRIGVLNSSNGGSKISLTGVSIVFCTYPAGKSVYKDERSFVDLSDSSGILLNNGRLSYSGIYLKDVFISGSLTYEPTVDTPLKLVKTTSGNFLHAKDDSSDETIGLHTDAQPSPTWSFGLKSSAANKYAPPTHGYIYGVDGAVGLVGDSSNKVVIDNADSFVVTHHGIEMLTANYSTGIHINSTANAYPALIVNGGASLSTDIQQWQNYAGTPLSVVNKDGKLGIRRSSVSYDLDVQGSGRFVYVFTTSGVMFSDGSLQTTAVSGNPLAVSGWASATISATGAAVSGWANYRDQQVSGWAATAIAQVSGLTGGTTYSAGSGMVLQGTTFHASNTFAANILANSASGAAISGWSAVNSASGDAAVSGYVATTISTTGAAVSGWVNYRDAQVSGWSSVNSASGDAAVSGFAATTISTTGAAISGWANYRDAQVSGWAAYAVSQVSGGGGTTYSAGSGLVLQGTTFHAVNTFAAEILANSASGAAISGWSSINSASGDAAVSGFASSTISATGAAVSGWANYRDTQISGWSSVNAASGDLAVSGYAATTISVTGINISGWANYRDTQISGWSSVNSASGDLAVSGYATTTIAATGAAVSGWADYRDAQVSGWAGATISATGAAVSGWSSYNAGVLDSAVSGWALSTIAATGASVSGYAATTISTTGINISGFAGYGDAQVSGWTNFTFQRVEEKNVHIQGTLSNMSFNLVNKALTQKRITVLNGLKTTSGVGFVGIYVDGSGVAGLTSLYATPTQSDNSVTAGSGLVAVNNKVTVVISGVSSAVDLQFTLGMIPA